MRLWLLVLALQAAAVRAADPEAYRRAVKAYEKRSDELRGLMIELERRVAEDPAGALGPEDALSPIETLRTELARLEKDVLAVSEGIDPASEDAKDFDRARYSVDDSGARSLRAARTLRAFILRRKPLFDGLTALESGLGALEREPRREGEEPRAAFARRLAAFDKEGGRLWGLYREATLEADRWERDPPQGMGRLADQARRVVNPAAERIAALRDRLSALSRERGLDVAARRGGHGGVGVREGLAGLARVPEAAERKALNGPAGWALKDGLDLAVSAAFPPAKPGRAPTEEETALRLQIWEDRLAGRIRTVGDPVGRAPFVHRQEGGTCGLCVQVQVVRLAGAAPERSTSRGLEDEFYREALRRGWIGKDGVHDRKEDGTPAAHLGSLLTEYGIPYVKRDRFDEPTFDASVRSGRVLIVGASADVLWGRSRGEGPRNAEEPDPDGTDHVVLVTGAEARTSDGEIAVYYVNDTGSFESARPVPAETMRRAISKAGGVYLEIR